jgi:hypothetical protein
LPDDASFKAKFQNLGDFFQEFFCANSVGDGGEEATEKVWESTTKKFLETCQENQQQSTHSSSSFW